MSSLIDERTARHAKQVEHLATMLRSLRRELDQAAQQTSCEPLTGLADQSALDQHIERVTDVGFLFAETAFGGEWNESLSSVREGRYKLVAGVSSGRDALYDLVADPRERQDAAQRLPEVSTRLRAALRDRSGAAGPNLESVELSPDEQERLRALGYVP